jgi:hypothetical protein
MERTFRNLEGLQSVLDIPFIRRTRRNHGLEHASIHLLSHKIKDLRMVGRSDQNGFWLWGDVKTEDVREAVDNALTRMRGGEHNLAIHPNCGTNLVTVATLGTVATMAALMGSERDPAGKMGRVPLILFGILMAAIFGQPLGRSVQEHVTTLGDPGDLRVVEIRPSTRGGMTAHRVETRSS